MKQSLSLLLVAQFALFNGISGGQTIPESTLPPAASLPAPGLHDQPKTWREIISAQRESVFAVVMENKLLGKKFSGTGFVIEPKYENEAGAPDHNFIITSLHIVQGASDGFILNSDQVTYRVDGLVHADIKNDIAVLQVPRLNVKGVSLGDPKKSLQVGDDVAVFGYPTYPEFYDGSLSTGIVAAYSRKRDEITRVVVNEFLQLTTPPAKGSSGSPVFNKHGQVVGMVNALYNPNEDSDAGFATFAIAALANKVNDLVIWLQEKGKTMGTGTGNGFAVVPLNYIRKGVTIEDLQALQTEEFINFRNADTGGQRGLKKEYAEALLKKAEQSPLAQYLLAKALGDVRLVEEATRAYERATELDGTYAEAWHYLGRSCLDQHQQLIDDKKTPDPLLLEKGLRALKKAVDHMDVPQTRFYYGEGLLVANRFVEAAEQLEAAFRMNDEEPNIAGSYFYALVKAKNFDRARQIYPVVQKLQVDMQPKHSERVTVTAKDISKK